MKAVARYIVLSSVCFLLFASGYKAESIMLTGLGFIVEIML